MSDIIGIRVQFLLLFEYGCIQTVLMSTAGGITFFVILYTMTVKGTVIRMGGIVRPYHKFVTDIRQSTVPTKRPRQGKVRILFIIKVFRIH